MTKNSGIDGATIFPKNMSLMVKGVAIIMMIAHHCFAFPAFWLDDFHVGAITTEICKNFKICVSFFAFITGYGLYVGKESSGKDIIVKLLYFLGQYWLQLFLILIPIASIGYSFSARKILFNLFALYDNIVLFAWYVFFHSLVLVTFPLVKRVLRHSLLLDLAMILAGGYCVTVLLYFLPSDTPLVSMLLDCSIYYPVVGIGYLTARDNLLNRVNEKFHIKVPAAVLLVVAVLLLRTRISVIKGFSFDVFYTPLLILALCQLLEKCRFSHPVLAFFGETLISHVVVSFCFLFCLYASSSATIDQLDRYPDSAFYYGCNNERNGCGAA